MPSIRMLTADQRESFEQRGLCRLASVFPAADARVMVDRIWETLERQNGVCRDDPETWHITQATGLQALRSEPIFQSIGSADTCAALDDLLGMGRWRRPAHWGQFLVSFPTADRDWTVPHETWHTDSEYQAPRHQLSGVLMFSFLSLVRPRCGGTAVIEGSHRLVSRFVAGQTPDALTPMKRARKAFLASDPWLCALTSDVDAVDRVVRFMERDHEIGGISVRVGELTGQPGDIMLAHPRLVHAPAANCGDQPRMMCIQRVHSTE